MADINLLQNDSAGRPDYGSFASKAVSKLLGIILILIVVLYIALLGYGYWSNRQLDTVEADVAKAQSEALASKDRNELVTRQEQLSNLETLIDNHVYWSYLLPELARVTLKSAKYTEVTAKRTGELDMTVNLPNYDEIEKFMQIFDLPEYNQQFSNVRIVNINTVQTQTAIATQVRLLLNFNPQYIKGRM